MDKPAAVLDHQNRTGHPVRVQGPSEFPALRQERGFQDMNTAELGSQQRTWRASGHEAPSQSGGVAPLLHRTRKRKPEKRGGQR